MGLENTDSFQADIPSLTQIQLRKSEILFGILCGIMVIEEGEQYC